MTESVSESASGNDFSEKNISAIAIRNENSLVSYSGIEEYLPFYKLSAPCSAPCLNWESGQGNHENERLATTIATDDWQTCASFQIEFQTRQSNDCKEQRLLVHNLHTGTIETWSSLKTDRLQQWIVEQTREALPSVKAEISQVQILQSLQFGRLTIIGDRTLQSIHANQPFTIDCLVQFTSLPAVSFNADAIGFILQSGCHVRCCAQNLSTGTAIELHNTPIDFHSVENHVAEDRVAGDHFVEDHTVENWVYQFQLPQLTLPEPGIYRLSLCLSIPNLSTPNLSVPNQPDLLTSLKLSVL